MKRLISIALVLGVVSLSCGVRAEPDSTWKGEAELGFVNTTGNTQTRNIAARGKVVNDRDKWRHTLIAEALNNSEEGNITAERYFASGKSDYKLSEKSYGFGLLTYENDRFSGYDFRVTETLGYGRSVIKSDTLILDLEVGPGARQSKLSDTGDMQYEGLLHLAGNFEWKLSDTSKFTEDLSSDIGEKAIVTRSVTALKTQIVGDLSSKISYTARYSTKVPPDVKNLDTVAAVTLVYGF